MVMVEVDTRAIARAEQRARRSGIALRCVAGRVEDRIGKLLPADVEAFSATDDGSEGHHGLVTDLLTERLPWADQVFACGPNPMFGGVADAVRRARSRKPVQALLEEHMGCGTGVCYGCAVFTRKGVRLVCRDGPRFELRQVFD